MPDAIIRPVMKSINTSVSHIAAECIRLSENLKRYVPKIEINKTISPAAKIMPQVRNESIQALFFTPVIFFEKVDIDFAEKNN